MHESIYKSIVIDKSRVNRDIEEKALESSQQTCEL